jgi:predicted DsbA family dithiol-disulfide isomerase
MRERLEAAAPEAGIRFRFDEIPVRPNTHDAHRVIRWAQGQGLGGAAVEALFHAFFEELRDIGDPATLAAIAGEIGLDAAVVADLLATPRDSQEVATEEMFVRRLGIAGVPVFIANGKRAVEGAQEPAVLHQLLNAAIQE